jgi:DNA-binding Lrp family transcriptional regulator
MAVKGYVLIETEVGTAKAVAEKLNDLREKDTRVTGVDTVTGPFDVIALLQANDLNDLGSCITQTIQVVSGVKRTTTCLSVTLD